MPDDLFMYGVRIPRDVTAFRRRYKDPNDLAALEEQGEKQREQAHAGATSNSYCRRLRKSGQSKAMPGSVLRPGAMSL